MADASVDLPVPATMDPIAAVDGQPAEFVSPGDAWVSDNGDLPPYIPSLSLNVRKLFGNDRADDRLRRAGLRRWEDPAQAPAAVRDLGAALADGGVAQHQAASFKKQYARAFGDAARAGAWPWQSLGQATLATVHGGQLGSTAVEVGRPVYVVDEAAPLKESLVELAGHDVLVSAEADGVAVAALLEANGVEVVLLSRTDVSVRGEDGEALSPNADRPLLTAGLPWLATVAALVLELKSGTRFRSERAQQAFLERLRQVRVARVKDVDILVDGASAKPPPGARSVPLPDGENPTVVVWDTSNAWDECQACAGSLCQLLGQPSLHEAFELTLIKLERSGADAADGISDEPACTGIGHVDAAGRRDS